MNLILVIPKAGTGKTHTLSGNEDQAGIVPLVSRFDILGYKFISSCDDI